MDRDTALRELRGVTYKDWTVHFTYGVPGAIAVRAEFWAENSTPRDLDPRPRVIGEHAGRLYVADITTVDELHRRVLDWLHDVPELHETREFYKVDGRAPFHPHTIDGEARWHGRERVAA